MCFHFISSPEDVCVLRPSGPSPGLPKKPTYFFPCFSVAQRVNLAGCFQGKQSSLFYAKAALSDPVGNNFLQGQQQKRKKKVESH